MFHSTSALGHQQLLLLEYCLSFLHHATAHAAQHTWQVLDAVCAGVTYPAICTFIFPTLTGRVSNAVSPPAAAPLRYVHEADVPTNLETQEALMDWALDRMGLAEGEVHVR
jgi:hypothetical protein